MAFDNLQYNVYRFFEYWQQGIDTVFGSDNDNSNVSVPCPFYRDGTIQIYGSSTWIDTSGYRDTARCFARCTVDKDSLNFLHDFEPIDYLPGRYWTEEDKTEAYNAIMEKYQSTGFNIGMDENHVGEYLYFDNNSYDKWVISENSSNPFEIDKNSNRYYGKIAPRYDDQSLDIDSNFSSPFQVYLFFKLDSKVVGTNISQPEINYYTGYNEYNNHYTENGITVYYSDTFTFINYEGEKTYNEVRNVVNNAYNNDNSVTIKVNAPSYETVKNGDRHPYYIAPIQPLQIPELGEMSLPSGDFGDAPKILAESVNEMTGLLDHLGLTAIFIICALLVFIIRKVRD